MMKTFVISLKASKDRREIIQNKLSALKINFEFFDAVELKGSDKTSGRVLIAEDVAKKILRRPMSTNEIGCAISHLAVYKKILEENVEEALILEDDADCMEQLPEILSWLSSRSCWEVVLLGHWSFNEQSMSKGAEVCFFGKQRVLDRYICKASEFPLGAYAYAIKRSAAMALTKSFEPVRMPADYVTGGAESIGLDLKLVSPPVVRHLPGKSEIGEREVRPVPKQINSMWVLIKNLIRKTLLNARKFGIYRRSYVWVFNQNFNHLRTLDPRSSKLIRY